MRQIKVNEIKPNMTIRWTHNKVTYECPVMDRDGTDKDGGLLCHVTEMHSQYVHPEVEEVTVVSEPQPEEPTTFGARVMAGGLMFVRVIHHERPWMVSLDGELYDWNDLCKLGSVAVIEAEPYWEIPTDVDSDSASKVPDRIEVWPENDEHLRDYLWLDSEGDTWTWDHTVSRWKCTSPSGKHLVSRTNPFCAPWIRITIKEQKEN